MRLKLNFFTPDRPRVKPKGKSRQTAVRKYGRIWTPAMDQQLTALFPDHTRQQIADLMGLRETQIKGRQRVLGLKKADPVAFTTAHLKKVGYKGCFTKGHLPANTIPDGDGAIRVRVDHQNRGRIMAYQWIRLSRGKWYHLHRYAWEQANGPVPKGYMVTFVDGDTMNCALSNLTLITRAENAERNRDHVKAAESMRALYASGQRVSDFTKLTDKVVANCLFKNQPEMKAMALTDPGLIEAKRQQLLLKRQLKNVQSHDDGNRTTPASPAGH